MSSGNESDAEPMSTDMLEYIHDGSQSHPSLNSREACYKIIDRIKQGQAECKGALLSTKNMGKGLYCSRFQVECTSTYNHNTPRTTCAAEAETSSIIASVRPHGSHKITT